MYAAFRRLASCLSAILNYNAYSLETDVFSPGTCRCFVRLWYFRFEISLRT